MRDFTFAILTSTCLLAIGCSSDAGRTCETGQTQCDPGGSNGVQTCNASGQWGSTIACNNQTCVNGACTSSSPIVCAGTGGPTMVALPTKGCIDSTEVTIGQYQAWLSATPSTSNQQIQCSWNISYTPDASCMSSMGACKDANCPQVCVNWCDAEAYCHAVGKRLCETSEWLAACEAGATNGGDMIGSAGDWEATCQGNVSPIDFCDIRDGAFNTAGDNCINDGLQYRNYFGTDIGFRCCSS